MSWWLVGLVCNTVIAIAYLLITLAIVRPLVRSGQLRSNPLGAATATIFFTCAVHHGAHAVHMVMPWFGADLEQGLAMRAAWGWQLALWDVVGAAAGAYYWTLRRSYSSLMEGAALFQDFRAREQQALEINDGVLQGLVVARMALELGERDRAMSALDGAISTASGMVTDLLGAHQRGGSAGLLRSSAATVTTTPAPAATSTPDQLGTLGQPGTVGHPEASAEPVQPREPDPPVTLR